MFTVRPRGVEISFRIRRRSLTVTSALVALTVLAGLAGTFLYGDMTPAEALRTLTGHGSRSDEFLLYTLRAPRLLCAAVVGLALGASGAVFQSLTRNPLGSPDVIGLTSGSSTGAVLAITVVHAGIGMTAAGALAGGLGTAALVYLLAFRRGVQGYRMILVGIGVGALLHAATGYLLTRARLEDAQVAQVWLVGSLNGRGWTEFFPAAAALAVLLPLALAAARWLPMLEMGDDTARGLGLWVETTRLVLALLGVALVGLATATAGPISFVALAAPQVARRLTGASGPGVLPAALTGALLTVAGDIAAERVFPGGLPVGVVSGATGGAYLAWLLARELRAGR
ncbi:FecCD family ABC transporter permease [Actinoallomurus acaciae]|uniref:FecCD family ABC transporter permease n=1 Tax=Actinoallomurus acaciae TaxID=502577 RepID=A0ABV5YJJ2_9ACTN